ncbi:hypothetical protein OAF83_01805 [Rubripirellula sp.]|nr:hypothetical protein [Rubripirellula sp.]MDB4749616.1 hypothetical protein [Rubripirellula sp.]
MNATAEISTKSNLKSSWTSVPPVPESISELGIADSLVHDLALKLASTVPQFDTKWGAERLHLPVQLAEKVFWKLKQDHFLEVLSQEGPFCYRYSCTDRGRQLAARSFEVSGYVGPLPISLPVYTAALKRQQQHRAQVTLEKVRSCISPLVLPEYSVQISALAALSGRSLFLFGPAGNGKTTLGRLLHQATAGSLWIPHAIAVDNSIIRIYDYEVHETEDISKPPANDSDTLANHDRRWVHVKRPFIVAGGEMTIEELDLAYSPSLRFYESPPHLKANGGTFLIDDFGRQRVAPSELLNRWIVPLENHVDHLTLQTGQKIQVPFDLMLIVATNLTVEEVADPAFLRRMGYRLHMERPTKERYSEIFMRYAESVGAQVPDGAVQSVIDRYEQEARELRGAEPRDLIERARDICTLHEKPLQLSADVIDLAWEGYFGNTPK